MKDKANDKVGYESLSQSLLATHFSDQVPLLDTNIVSTLTTTMDALIVSSPLLDHVSMMDIGAMSSLTTTMDIGIVSSLTMTIVGSPIVNLVTSLGGKYIALKIEQVAHDIQMESPAEVVDGSIILEGPYKPQDMVVEDYVTSILSNLGFVALKRQQPHKSL